MAEPSSRSKLTIIVTSYGKSRLSDLESLLNSLEKQESKNFDLVFVVEDAAFLVNSLNALCARLTGVKYRILINEDEPGISASRNLGVRVSDSDFIAFVDDDTILPRHWTKTLQNEFNDSATGAVTGPAIPMWMDKSSSWLPTSMHWLVSCTTWYHSGKRGETRSVWGMNMGFSRDIFDSGLRFPEAVGGIRGKRLHGEEAVLSILIRGSLKRAIIYDPELYVFHKVYSGRRTGWFIVKSAYNMGSTRRMQKRLVGSYSSIQIDRDLVAEMLRQGIGEAIPELVSAPLTAIRKIRTTVLVLISSALGYCLYYSDPLLRHSKE